MKCGVFLLQGPNAEKAMQLEKLRIIMDRNGIKRLEPCGDDVLAKARHHMHMHMPHGAPGRPAAHAAKT